MPQKRPSSKRQPKKSVERICHQLSSCELDSSGTSSTSSGSRGSVSRTSRDPESLSESELRSVSSYSSDTELCPLSEEDRTKGCGDSSASGSTRSSFSDLTSRSSSSSSSNSSGWLLSNYRSSSSASDSRSHGSSKPESWVSSVTSSSESEMDTFSATYFVDSESSSDEFVDPWARHGMMRPLNEMRVSEYYKFEYQRCQRK